jgi:hypothetical protein
MLPAWGADIDQRRPSPANPRLFVTNIMLRADRIDFC